MPSKQSRGRCPDCSPAWTQEVHPTGEACCQKGGQEARLLHLWTTELCGRWLTGEWLCRVCLWRWLMGKWLCRVCLWLTENHQGPENSIISRVTDSFLALQSVQRQTRFLKAAKYAKVLLKMCKINKYTSQMNKNIFKLMKWEDAWNRHWCVQVQSSPDGLSVEAWLRQSRKDF